MINVKESTTSKELTVQELAVKFYQLFPEWMDIVQDVERIGPCSISIKLRGGISLVWLWVNEDDWQLGTRLWRRPPKSVEKKWKKEKSEKTSESTKSEGGTQDRGEQQKNVRSKEPADPLTVPMKGALDKALKKDGD